ncbi:hypothetical protein [Leucobacter chromiireducens]|uniref:hypothetical protein n=1 Tax=Leucobacter chromiireducens TaxID=283877 RepID=UPI000F63C54B|nr:hypothetical protein [Leucobacter chromiireducens]
MSEKFIWLPGAVGAWLAERLDTAAPHADADVGVRRATALGDIVPAGYDTVVRILHRMERTRPATGSFAEWEALAHSERWADAPDFVTEPVRWHDAAAALGTADAVAAADAPRSSDVLGAQGDGPAADGWRYEEPRMGSLDPEAFAATMCALVRHTRTPDAGVAAVWEGYGGLVSAQGVGWFFVVSEQPSWVPRWLVGVRARLTSRIGDFVQRRRAFGGAAAWRGLFRLPQPEGSGILPREAAVGERLELPDRAYVCFAAGPDELARPDWPQRAPWIGEREFGGPQTPNVVWPEGREWVLVSEIGFDSTLIACSRACAAALLATPGIEAFEIDRDTWLI